MRPAQLSGCSLRSTCMLARGENSLAVRKAPTACAATVRHSLAQIELVNHLKERMRCGPQPAVVRPGGTAQSVSVAFITVSLRAAHGRHQRLPLLQPPLHAARAAGRGAAINSSCRRSPAAARSSASRWAHATSSCCSQQYEEALWPSLLLLVVVVHRAGSPCWCCCSCSCLRATAGRGGQLALA